MTLLDMPRRQRMFRLDERVLDALEKVSTKTSVNAYVEGLLFEFLKRAGHIDPDEQPLKETRGGSRKPKAESTEGDNA
jgi:hypothetical protein